MSNDQLLAKIGKFGYCVEVNINDEEPLKPGTALVWKSSIPVQDTSVLMQCRCQVAFLGNLVLMNVYAHSGSDKRQERNDLFSKEMFQFMGLHANSSFICGGDFNSILSIHDVENGTGYSQKYSQQLADLVRVHNLVDGFRFLNPAAERASAAYSRLDRFYLSASSLFKI